VTYEEVGQGLEQLTDRQLEYLVNELVNIRPNLLGVDRQASI
jgi:hypothetical protein